MLELRQTNYPVVKLGYLSVSAVTTILDYS